MSFNYLVMLFRIARRGPAAARARPAGSTRGCRGIIPQGWITSKTDATPRRGRRALSLVGYLQVSPLECPWFPKAGAQPLICPRLIGMGKSTWKAADYSRRVNSAERSQQALTLHALPPA